MGRKAVPIWADGKRFDSTGEARKALGVNAGTLQEFYAALRGECLFRGMRLSREAALPGDDSAQEPCAKAAPVRPVRVLPAIHKRGEPLIRHPVTHNLGVYRG